MTIPKNWTFNDTSVSQHFDSHVVEQLPWYPMVTRAVAFIAKHYMSEHGTFIDVGASNGNIGRACEDFLAERGVEFIPLEPSKQMADTYNGYGRMNLRRVPAESFAFNEYSPNVITFMLTIMFVDPDARLRMLTDALKSLTAGGAAIIVDRCEPEGGYFDTVMARLVLNEKIVAGADPAEVLRKELSLAGVQVPVDRTMIEDLGGREFFRFGPFAGWVITKTAYDQSVSSAVERLQDNDF